MKRPIIASKHRLTKRLALPLFFLFVAVFAKAQTGQVSGTVKDISGNPLSGASVIVEATGRGTSTDNAGNYTLSRPEKSLHFGLIILQ